MYTKLFDTLGSVSSNDVILGKIIQKVNKHLFEISEIACVTPSLFEALTDAVDSDEPEFVNVYGFYMGIAHNSKKYILISSDSQLFSSCGLLVHRILSKHLHSNLKNIILIASFLILAIQPNAVKIYQHIINLILHGTNKLLVKIHYVLNALLTYYPKNAHIWNLKEIIFYRIKKVVCKNPFFSTLKLKWLIIIDLKLNYDNSDAQVYRQMVVKWITNSFS